MKNYLILQNHYEELDLPVFLLQQIEGWGKIYLEFYVDLEGITFMDT